MVPLIFFYYSSKFYSTLKLVAQVHWREFRLVVNALVVFYLPAVATKVPSCGRSAQFPLRKSEIVPKTDVQYWLLLPTAVSGVFLLAYAYLKWASKQRTILVTNMQLILSISSDYLSIHFLSLLCKLFWCSWSIYRIIPVDQARNQWQTATYWTLLPPFQADIGQLLIIVKASPLQ